MPQFGWEDKERSRSPGADGRVKASDQSELVIDPALRSNTPREGDKKTYEPRESVRTHSPSMPLRAVEPTAFMSSHRRQHFDDSHRLPSPPASIGGGPVPHSHSPSPSVASADRSSISTPPIRRSPPHQSSMPPPPHLFQSSYHHDPSMIQSSRHQHPDQQHFARADHLTHGPYIYAPPPPPFDHRYDHPHSHPSPYTAPGIPAHFTVPPPMAHHPTPSYGHPYPQPGPQPPVQIMHTDDAATKLSDRVRRRCFNCCTTDTSTWRRSNLSPGKVLCNKCGLFERTHSRPRPEQFPHKRGPLATTSLQRRTPPANSNGGSQQQQHHNTHFAPPPHPQHLPPIGGPQYQYSHPSIPPLGSGGAQDPSRRDLPPGSGGGNQLPGLQSWHGHNSSNGPPNGGPSEAGGSSHHGSPHLGGPGSAPHSRRASESHGGSGGGGGGSSQQQQSGGGGQRLPTPPPSLSRSVNSSGESVRDPGPNSSAARETAV